MNIYYTNNIKNLLNYQLEEIPNGMIMGSWFINILKKAGHNKGLAMN